METGSGIHRGWGAVVWRTGGIGDPPLFNQRSSYSDSAKAPVMNHVRTCVRAPESNAAPSIGTRRLPIPRSGSRAHPFSGIAALSPSESFVRAGSPSPMSKPHGSGEPACLARTTSSPSRLLPGVAAAGVTQRTKLSSAGGYGAHALGLHDVPKTQQTHSPGYGSPARRRAGPEAAFNVCVHAAKISACAARGICQ